MSYSMPVCNATSAFILHFVKVVFGSKLPKTKNFDYIKSAEKSKNIRVSKLGLESKRDPIYPR